MNNPIDSKEHVPIVGGVIMIPITHIGDDGAEDMFLCDFYVGNHVVTARRHRFALRRSAIEKLVKYMNSLEWSSDIPQWDRRSPLPSGHNG